MKLSALSLTTKIIAGLALAVVVLGLLWLSSCDSRRGQAVQTRVDEGQIGALSNSAADAINTQAAANEREREAADLTRQNERDIRHAQGADAPLDPALRDASLLAWCRRPTYRDTPRCRVLQSHPR